jgi:Fe-S-cluster containining protein
MNRQKRRAAAASARRGAPPVEASLSSPTEVHRFAHESGKAIGLEALSKGRSPARVYELFDRAAAFAESFRARHRGEPTGLACKRGCNHCCHMPVASTGPAVLRMAAALRERLSKADFAAALARVVALDEKTRGVPWSPGLRAPTPCAFLVDGACSVYAVRPFVCRAWNSTDAEACKRALSEETVPMRFDVFQRATFAGIESGIKEALSAYRLDTQDLELAPAMRVAMQNEDACERWLAGEPLFAGCEARPSAATTPGGAKRALPTLPGMGSF